MDLARAPCRAPLTARKKGSGYENEGAAYGSNKVFRISRRKFDTFYTEIELETTKNSGGNMYKSFGWIGLKNTRKTSTFRAKALRFVLLVFVYIVLDLC
jgi:hypothetical protein